MHQILAKYSTDEFLFKKLSHSEEIHGYFETVSILTSAPDIKKSVFDKALSHMED